MHSGSIQCQRALILKYNFLMNLGEDIYCTMGFPGCSDSKESTCNSGDLGLIPGLGRYPGEESGNPLQYSCLENPMDGVACWATVHGVSKHWTRLSDFHIDIRILYYLLLISSL